LLLQPVRFACGFFSVASLVALPATVKLPQVETTCWSSGSSLQRLDGSIVGQILWHVISCLWLSRNPLGNVSTTKEIAYNLL
jgi:hypothetical protein